MLQTDTVCGIGIRKIQKYNANNNIVRIDLAKL